MKISQISVDEFNKLAKCEPCASIYQSSYWSDLMIKKGYEPLFIQYSDDSNMCVALSMFLLKKDSILSFKPTAYSPFGYLINYYDKNLLSMFNHDLVVFLREKKVGKIVIEPSISLHNDKYTNEAVVKSLLECGYIKSKNLFVYNLSTAKHQEHSNTHYIIHKVNETDERILYSSSIKEEYLEVYEAIKPNASIYEVKLDSFKTRRTIEEKIIECEEYIKKHKSDYKYIDKIPEKKKEIENYNMIESVVDKFEEKNGIDGLLAIACVCKYAGKCNIMFIVNYDKNNFFEAENALIDKIVEDCKKEGFKNIESLKPFVCADEIELLGEYIMKI